MERPLQCVTSEEGGETCGCREGGNAAGGAPGAQSSCLPAFKRLRGDQRSCVFRWSMSTRASPALRPMRWRRRQERESRESSESRAGGGASGHTARGHRGSAAGASGRGDPGDAPGAASRATAVLPPGCDSAGGEGGAKISDPWCKDDLRWILDAFYHGESEAFSSKP